MNPAQIAESYDSIAHLWLESHLEKNGINQHELALRFREHYGLALDVGSGCNGRFIRLLESHGYEVEALDISEKMIALAKTRNPKTTFHQADICEWVAGKKYDFITAWDSIWHVPLVDSEKVLSKLCNALNPGGVFIWSTAGLDEPAEKRDSTMGSPVYYSALGIPKTLHTITKAGCVCRHLEYDQLPEKHLFIVAQKI